MTALSEIRGRGLIKRVALPDVAGLHVDNAKIVLRSAGFELVRVHYTEDYAVEFSVLEQFPRAGLLASPDGEVVLRVARRNLINFLPQVFQQPELDGGGSFLRGFLNIIQTLSDSVTQPLRHIHEYFDPRTCDPEFLPWLASWLAIGLNPDWSTLQRRKMLMAAAQLFPERGTARAIQEFVRIYVGAAVRIKENTWPFQGFRIGVHSTVGEDTVILPPMNLAHCFVVELDKAESNVDDHEIIKIHQIIQAQKPAHTSYFLSFSNEMASSSMGMFMAIGMSAPEVMELGGEMPVMSGMAIGVGSDGEVHEGQGGSGLIQSNEVRPQDAETSEDAAARKKKPMRRVGSPGGEGDDGDGNA